MSTFVIVNTYTHSVTYVANNLLLCLQEIIKKSGLDPGKIAEEWVTLERGIATWLETEHLTSLRLEVFDPRTDDLVGRWDFTISYGWAGGSGSFWVDTAQIEYAIRKQGLWPASCNYEIIVTTKPGRLDVPGWTNLTYTRSTDGFVRQSIGTTLDAGGLGAATTYYRRK
jgi:Bacterial HORMA domain 2